MAPSLGCLILRQSSSRGSPLRINHYDLFFIPVSRFSMEAVKVELREPGKELFEVPKGFRQEEAVVGFGVAR